MCVCACGLGRGVQMRKRVVDERENASAYDHGRGLLNAHSTGRST